MLWTSLAVGLLQLTAVHSKPLTKRWEDIAEKHAWKETPQGWERLGDAPPDLVFDLRLGLKQHKQAELIESLYEISDPSHARQVFPLYNLSKLKSV